MKESREFPSLKLPDLLTYLATTRQVGGLVGFVGSLDTSPLG
jgi:hypothetical protein